MEKECCHSKNWYKEPLYIVLLVIGGIFVSHFILSLLGSEILQPVLSKFLSYLGQTWWAIIIGFLIGSLIDVLVPQQLMVQLLGRGKGSIFLAVGLGFLASACSHGILAIAASLYKKGASTSATLAFLLAAPWANIAITILLFSLFGLKALLIVGGALLVAVLSGFIFQYLEEKRIIEGGKDNIGGNTEKIVWVWPGFGKLMEKMFLGSWSLAKMVLWWILIGFLLAAFLGAYMPENLFNQFLGPTFLGLTLTLVLASIMEICSEGTAPVAFEIFKKTGAFGNTFVFLQAGVVTDFTEIGMISTVIGKKAALALALVGVPLILILGLIFNQIKF